MVTRPSPPHPFALAIGAQLAASIPRQRLSTATTTSTNAEVKAVPDSLQLARATVLALFLTLCSPAARTRSLGSDASRCEASRSQQARQESNLQPPVLETGALPIELRT